MSAAWPAEREIRGWKELFDQYQRIVERPGRWVFRGQKASDTTLMTTLERAVGEFYPDAPRKSFAIESRLLQEFRRRAHQYLESLPPEYDTLDWLALMRHYGAPTRLLDWTNSFFVAAYFALKESADAYAILALDARWCRDRSNAVLGERPGKDVFQQDGSERQARKFDRFFRPPRPKPFVYPLNPFRLNERLTTQQAIFLCPGDISRTFQENLDALRRRGDAADRYIRFRIPKKARREILQHLYRMNMDGRTLTPGLEGFASSLNTMIALPWISREGTDA